MSNLISLRERILARIERNGSVRCKGVWKDGSQCFFRARLDSEFCEKHRKIDQLKRSCPIEAIRLENVEGFAHEAAADALHKCGFSVISKGSGWPDLLVKKNRQLFAIEGKKGPDTLKDNQRRVLEELNGVMPCFVLRLDAPCGDGEITWAHLLEQLSFQSQLPEYYGA